MDTALGPGFAEPVEDAQAAFRAVLDAMARPGRIRRLVAPPDAPAPLDPAAAALALTLLDYETPVWLDAALDRPQLHEWLGFHTGAPRTAAPDAAAFALIADAARMPPIDRFQPGSDAYPDRSATLILQVTRLGSGSALRLAGPGIEGQTSVLVDGLPADFIRQWRENRSRFPLGVDVVLTAGEEILALPRTTSIEG
jgi:alpha-D-ribose 1-methylphosphonate 5-triphosphate synthase subunit PhnH